MCPPSSLCRLRRSGRARCVCRPCDVSELHTGPVCGFDSRTYASACRLHRANCRASQHTNVDYTGPCQSRYHSAFHRSLLLPTPPALVGRSISRVCVCVCRSVCLFVRVLTGKRLELSTPNLVHVYSIAVARHALTERSKGQRSRSHSYENRHGRTVASE